MGLEEELGLRQEPYRVKDREKLKEDMVNLLWAMDPELARGFIYATAAAYVIGKMRTLNPESEIEQGIFIEYARKMPSIQGLPVESPDFFEKVIEAGIEFETIDGNLNLTEVGEECYMEAIKFEVMYS